MFTRALLCSLVFFLSGIQDTYTFVFNFKHPNGTDIDNLSEHCKSNDCVVKCCPEKHILFGLDVYLNCTSSFELIQKFGVKDPDNYSDIIVYDKHIQRNIIKRKTANQLKFIYAANFTEYAVKLRRRSRPEQRKFLLEDGKFVFYRANYWQPWKPVLEPRQYCIEHEVSLSEDYNVSTTPRVVVYNLPESNSSSNRRAMLTAYGLLVSCVFLVLVLAVYALLPELRNLAGLVVMAYMSTYFAFFLTRVILVFGNDAEVLSMNACVNITIVFYYLMLATFCWMNVMSFDIWQTFRKMPKYTAKSKFRWYCAHAWGVPVLHTLFVVIVDLSDLTAVPGFVKLNLWDNMCNIDAEAHLLYISVPIFLLICVNLTLFLMTAFNIWQVKRGVARYISQDIKNNKMNENRFWVYLRLSLLMGVSWILEVVSNIVNTKSMAWCITDFYNALFGLFIFLMFICKKNIFLRLCTRFSIDNKLVRYIRGRAQ